MNVKVNAVIAMCLALAQGGAVQAQETERPIFSGNRSYPVSMDEGITAGVALGDIDGDGDIDLVESNGRHWAHASYVYFNAEGRGFTKRVELGSEQTTGYRVELVDMDADGDLDAVVAADRLSNKLYLNDGTGNFAETRDFGSALSNTRSITVADLNGDGAPDVLEICRGTANNILSLIHI